MIKIDPNVLVDPKFIGIPYVLGGLTLRGCDCIGLAIMWYSEHGISYKYDDRHGPVLQRWWEHNPSRFISAMSELGVVISFDRIRKFDCLLFFGEDVLNRFPTCLGVMVDDRHFMTSTEDRGSFVTMLNSAWKGKFWGAMRLRKIVEEGLSQWEL